MYVCVLVIHEYIDLITFLQWVYRSIPTWFWSYMCVYVGDLGNIMICFFFDFVQDSIYCCCIGCICVGVVPILERWWWRVRLDGCSHALFQVDWFVFVHTFDSMCACMCQMNRRPMTPLQDVLTESQKKLRVYKTIQNLIEQYSPSVRSLFTNMTTRLGCKIQYILIKIQ